MMPFTRFHLRSLKSFNTRCITTTSTAYGPPPPSLLNLPSLTLDEHHRQAETWLDNFGVADIPPIGYEVSYSRSSGPGGQHVNKTNSKATLRCDLNKATNSWLPRFTLAPLSKSANYLTNPPALQISSQTSRSAPQNLQTAIQSLHQTILTAGRSVVIGATSDAQKARVRGLIRAEEGRRRDEKDHKKGKKESRRSGGWD